MRNEKRRLTSFVIALCMIIGLFQAAPIFAATETINTGVIKSADGWAGTGYTVNESWGQFAFSNWGGSGKYIYNKYDFTGDFEFLSKQMQVQGNTANILFCYQDDNNYYKLNLGASAATLSKCVNGKETPLATDPEEQQLTGTMSLRIVHTADGKITVTCGAAAQEWATAETNTPVVEATDTELTHGKMGLSFQYSAGYVAIMSFSGTVDVPEPTVAPTEAPYTVDYSENFDNFSDASSWINSGSLNLSVVSPGIIGGSDWGGCGVYLYKGKKFGSESYVYSADISAKTGGSPGNSGSVLFNYTANAGAGGSNQHGYAIEVQGGTAGTVALKKYTNNVWNAETIKTHKIPFSLQNKDVRVNVTYIAGGRISADLVVDGETYSLFKDIKDTTYTDGYIGVMASNSVCTFDNVNVTAATAPYYSLDNAAFTQTGNEVTVTADVTMGSGSASFVTAAYDVDGALIGLNIAPADAEGYSSTFEVSGTVASVMTSIWNLNTFNPYCSTAVK